MGNQLEILEVVNVDCPKNGKMTKYVNVTYGGECANRAAASVLDLEIQESGNRKGLAFTFDMKRDLSFEVNNATGEIAITMARFKEEEESKAKADEETAKKEKAAIAKAKADTATAKKEKAAADKAKGGDTT